MRDKAIEMAKRLTTDSIWKSANLEGLGTTFQKTEAILANAPTKATMEEVLFIVTMKHAWQFLLDNFNRKASRNDTGGLFVSGRTRYCVIITS